MISLGRYTNNHFFWILLTLFGGYGGGLYSQGIPGLNAIFSGTTKAVILTSITFKADVPVDQRELLYLTDLRTNVPLTGGDIQQAYERLLRKKRFTTVTFALNNRSCLEIHLTSHWLLKKVEVQGIWFGKYRYASLYQQQPGDDFDIAVHEESLKAITSFLHDEGYFASTLDVLLEREPIQKTIRVKLNISRKKQFSIVAADVGFEKNANNIPSFELSALKEELEQKFIKIIPSNFYTKELVEKQRGRHCRP